MQFIHARSDREVVFTRGATEAINLVANSWGGQYIGEGDEIVLSVMEHHSNLVPWQLLAQRKRAVLKASPAAAEAGPQMRTCGPNGIFRVLKMLLCV